MRDDSPMPRDISGWLTNHGYAPHQRDAVLSYVSRESGFRPSVVAASGACLLQWAGSRRRAMLALGNGQCPTWETQMDFADRELRTEPCFAAFWRAAPDRAFATLRRTFGKGNCR